MCKLDLKVNEVPRESMVGIDATPDNDYPIRILEAYLAANRGCRWSGSPGCPQMAAATLNAAHDRRADILEYAIQTLKDTRRAL